MSPSLWQDGQQAEHWFTWLNQYAQHEQAWVSSDEICQHMMRVLPVLEEHITKRLLWEPVQNVQLDLLWTLTW